MKNLSRLKIAMILGYAACFTACGGAGQDSKARPVAATASAQAAPVAATQSGQLDAAEQLHKQGMEARRKEDYDQAIALLEQAVKLKPNNPEYHHDLGVAYSYKPDMLDKAKQAYLKAIEVAPEPKAHVPAVLFAYYNLACVEALQGNKNKAIDYLETTIEMGFSGLEYLQNDKELDSLRGEPRFILLLRKATAKFSAPQ